MNSESVKQVIACSVKKGKMLTFFRIIHRFWIFTLPMWVPKHFRSLSISYIPICAWFTLQRNRTKWNRRIIVYPKKYAHGFCFAVLCCGYTLTDFPISIRLTSLALWQSNDCPSASKATLMNMDKYFMWIHYERLHNHNKAKHNKTVCIFLGIYCTSCIKLDITRVNWFI